MTNLVSIPFTVPDIRNPRPFSGFVCILYAGDRFHSGCDSNSPEDAYWNAVDSARRAMQLTVAVEKDFDPCVWAGTVQMFGVQEQA